MKDFCNSHWTPVPFSRNLSGDGYREDGARPLDRFEGTGLDPVAIERKPALEPVAAFPGDLRVVGLARSQWSDQRHGRSHSLAQIGGTWLLRAASQAPDCG